MNLADPSGLCPDSEGQLYAQAWQAFKDDPEFAPGSRQRRQYSNFVQGVPVLGPALTGWDAPTGHDPLAGTDLTGSQRAWGIGLTALAVAGITAANSGNPSYIDDAIAGAEDAGYRLGAGQRSVDWNNVLDLANQAQQNGNWDFLRGNDLIITGLDGNWITIDNGMHRILASVLSRVPLPEEMFLRGNYYSPSVPWTLL